MLSALFDALFMFLCVLYSTDAATLSVLPLVKGYDKIPGDCYGNDIGGHHGGCTTGISFVDCKLWCDNEGSCKGFQVMREPYLLCCIKNTSCATEKMYRLASTTHAFYRKNDTYSDVLGVDSSMVSPSLPPTAAPQPITVATPETGDRVEGGSEVDRTSTVTFDEISADCMGNDLGGINKGCTTGISKKDCAAKCAYENGCLAYQYADLKTFTLCCLKDSVCQEKHFIRVGNPNYSYNIRRMDLRLILNDALEDAHVSWRSTLLLHYDMVQANCPGRELSASLPSDPTYSEARSCRNEFSLRGCVNACNLLSSCASFTYSTAGPKTQCCLKNSVCLHDELNNVGDSDFSYYAKRGAPLH